jgi:hypothetical protein
VGGNYFEDGKDKTYSFRGDLFIRGEIKHSHRICYHILSKFLFCMRYRTIEMMIAINNSLDTVNGLDFKYTEKYSISRS